MAMALHRQKLVPSADGSLLQEEDASCECHTPCFFFQALQLLQWPLTGVLPGNSFEGSTPCGFHYY
jgi:hypothetical protein